LNVLVGNLLKIGVGGDSEPLNGRQYCTELYCSDQE